MVRIRCAKDAVAHPVLLGALKSKRKPRHIDTGLSAMFYLHEKDRNSDENFTIWITVKRIQKTIERKLYRRHHTLSRYFAKSFERALPLLAGADLIRFNERNESQFRLTKPMKDILEEASEKTGTLALNTDLEKHFVFCDYLRFKIGFYEANKQAVWEWCNELRDENKELRDQWDDHTKSCLTNPGLPSGTRASIGDTIPLDEPIAGPSTPHIAPATPSRSSRSPNPADAYRTPESLPRRRSYTSPAPSSPPASPSFGSHTPPSFQNENAGDDDNMDVDEPITGPSGASSPEPESEQTEPQAARYIISQLEAVIEWQQDDLTQKAAEISDLRTMSGRIETLEEEIKELKRIYEVVKDERDVANQLLGEANQYIDADIKAMAEELKRKQAARATLARRCIENYPNYQETSGPASP